MPASQDNPSIASLTTEFQQLRAELLRSARALVLVEDQRAAALQRMARHATPALARDLRADAHQARANADTATGVVVQLDRMSSRALTSTMQPRVGAESTFAAARSLQLVDAAEGG